MKKNLKLTYMMITVILTIVIPLRNNVYGDKYYVNIPGFVGEDLLTTISKARANAGIDTVYVGYGIYKLDAELIIEDVVIGGCTPDGSGGIRRKYPGEVNNLRSLQTILDGNSLANIPLNQKHRVATINIGGMLEGCVVRNGQVHGITEDTADMNCHGGGVLVNGGKIHNCIIRGNVAMNEAHSTDNPSRGGGVFITSNGGAVVNCIIAFNMDDKGLGVDGHSGAVVNNTIARNTVSPKYVFVSGNMDGKPEYRHYINTTGATPDSTKSGPYIRLNDFYIATTPITLAQHACFLAAIDLNSDFELIHNDWMDICNSLTPMSGYTDVTIADYLGLAKDEVSVNPRVIYPNVSPSEISIGGLIGDGSEVFYVGISESKYDAGKSGSVSYPADPLIREDFPSPVNWYGALVYSVWLGGFLPTEAQWEYAARKTPDGIRNDAAFSGGTTVLDDVAWYGGNSQYTVHQVATLKPTELGLYDMLGNVKEWVCDWANLTDPHASGHKQYPDFNSVLIGYPPVDGTYTVSQNAGTKGNKSERPLYNPIYNYKNLLGRRLLRGSNFQDNAYYLSFGYRGKGEYPKSFYQSGCFRIVRCVECP
jgi:formylglycine-generating enzyme required for sulfatase activity